MHISISNSSDEPIYEQIFNAIRDGILSGDLVSGEALPSIRSLARDLRISVITTKRAYEELEREGYIETVAGKGSFVTRKNTSLLREEVLKQAEKQLLGVVKSARYGNLSLEELYEILKYLYEEENHE